MSEQTPFDWEGSGKNRRDASLNKVEREPFKRLIARFIDQLLPGEYSSETIRNAAQAAGIRPHHFNAWGAAIMAAIKRKTLLPTSDYRASHAPAKHARRIRIYIKP